MASNLEQTGVKTLTSTTLEQLEDFINQFLSGDGTADDPRRELIFQPSFLVSGGSFYVMLYYKIA